MTTRNWGATFFEGEYPINAMLKIKCCFNANWSIQDLGNKREFWIPTGMESVNKVVRGITSSPWYHKIRPLIVAVLIICVSIVITTAVFRALTAMRSDYDPDPLIKDAQTEQLLKNSRSMNQFLLLAIYVSVFCYAYFLFQEKPGTIVVPDPPSSCPTEIFLHDQTGKESFLVDFEWNCNVQTILNNDPAEPDGLREAIELFLGHDRFSIHSACRVVNLIGNGDKRSYELKYYVQVETDCLPNKYSPEFNKVCAKVMIDVKNSRLGVHDKSKEKTPCTHVDDPSAVFSHSITFPDNTTRHFNCGEGGLKSKLALYQTVLDERLEKFKTDKSKFPEAFVLTSGCNCELKEIPLLVDDVPPGVRDLGIYNSASKQIAAMMGYGDRKFL